MKKLIVVLASVSLASIMPIVPATAAMQSTAVCVAKSPSAQGWATGYNMNETCQRALYECAIRTPPSQVCVVTNYWWEA